MVLFSSSKALPCRQVEGGGAMSTVHEVHVEWKGSDGEREMSNMWAGRGGRGARLVLLKDTEEVQEEGVLGVRLTAASHLGGWAARWGWGTNLAQGRPATAACPRGEGGPIVSCNSNRSVARSRGPCQRQKLCQPLLVLVAD
jgi:hypothetical protein